MAIPAAVPTPVTLPESLPQDHANSSFQTEMDIDVTDEDQPAAIPMLEARAGGGHEPAVKKLKRVHGEVEMVLRQTAEIVMVLVGVAALRGGAQPNPLECQLAAEAYEKLATLVTVSAPQDLVSKDALQSLIQQLTVPPPPARLAAKSVAIQSQSSRMPALATAPPASGPSPAPAPSAAAAVSKAPSQAPAQATTPSPSPSPLLSPAPVPAPESLSLTPETPSAPPVSTASSAQTSESEVPAPVTAPAPKPVAPASKSAPKTTAPAPSPALGKTKALDDVQTTPGTALGNGVTPSATPLSVPTTTTTNTPVAMSNTPKMKPGGRTSPVKQQATPSADAQQQPTGTTTTVVIKDQRGSQAPKALARQRGLKNVVQEPPVVVVLDPQQTHQQLALAVHLLLKPYIITPGLGKAALNYMSTPIPCGICKAVANTTTNVLVCDGCDGGFHLQCLQLSSTQSVPRSDWYCPKCVTTNAGRPQPPKYGPLRRGPAGQPGPKNSWAMQAGCGSDSSKGQAPGKLVLLSRKKEGDVVQASVVEPTPAVEACCVNPLPEAAVAREPDLEETQHRNGRGRAPISSKPKSVSEQDVAPEKPAQIGAFDDSIITVEWVGPVVSTSQDKLYYSACSVGGETIRLQDTAFFRPEAPDVPPYIARLQALWEDKSSGQKWVKVNWCYYPSDLPVNMGRPVISDPREVYESNHSDNNLVGSIQGPCLVLSPLQYQEEMERRSKSAMEGPMPLFLCQYVNIPENLSDGFMTPQEVYSELLQMHLPEVVAESAAAAAAALFLGSYFSGKFLETKRDGSY